MFRTIVFASLFACALAALAPPPPPVCPSNGGQLQLVAAPTPNGYEQFIPNVFVYTGNGQLMTGSPLGPYIGNFQNCFFVPNSTLSCKFTVYNDSALTLAIGTGTLLGTDFAVNASGGTLFFGGDLTVTTTIPSSPFPSGGPSTVNFRSGTFSIHYEASQLYPAPGSSQAALLNTIQYTAAETGFMSLWGSDGWTGSGYGSSAATGLDLRFQFFCPPQAIIPPECPTCSTPSSLYTVSSACASAGSTILRNSPSTCIGLDFESSASTSQC